MSENLETKKLIKKNFIHQTSYFIRFCNLNKIVVSKKRTINDKTYKHICGYLNNDTIQPLRVILPQMDGYIKYFDDGGKNMSFVTDDEKIYEKYNEVWEVIRNLLKIDFTVNPVRDDAYLVAYLVAFNNNNYIPMERNHYICIIVIDIDSVIKTDKRAYPQAYLEQCKYKLKKKKIVNYIDDEIIYEESDSDIDSDYNDTVHSYLKI